MNRLERQLDLPGFSEEEQKRLNSAKLLVIGAGGLGCPALLYLAAAGVGTIGVADGDTVSITNLNRQVIYGVKDVGKLKVQIASESISEKYSDILFHTIPHFLTVENALEIITQYDIVLDCTDNFSARYMINDACVLLKKPLVFGAIYKHEGQLMVFDPLNAIPLNYRHVHPHQPLPHEVPNCNSTGVLGVLPGMIGVMMATESIKLITGFGVPLVNKIVFINIRDNSRLEIAISPDPLADALVPVNEDEFNVRDYSLKCSVKETISWTEVYNTNNKLLVDVREDYEEPSLKGSSIVSFPFSEIIDGVEKDLNADALFVFCKSGLRSKKAVELLKLKFPGRRIISVDGGLDNAESPVNIKEYEKA